jgi:hypothetical protein
MVVAPAGMQARDRREPETASRLIEERLLGE